MTFSFCSYKGVSRSWFEVESLFSVFCPDATITGIIGKKLKPSLE